MTADPWPTMMIVGTQKAGTTWLQRALQRHPHVHFSDPKELFFFGQAGWDDPNAQAEYRRHFRNDDPAIVHRAEGSTNYFWRRNASSPFSPPVDDENDAARGIAAAIPTTPQLIVMLRSPVDRAVAGANHHLTMGRLAPTDDLFTAAPEWGIVDLGFYARHLTHWIDVFGREALHIVLFDDVRDRPRETFAGVLEWLGLDLDTLGSEDLDAIAQPSHTRAEIRRHRGVERDDYPLSPQTVRRLAELYADDIERTAALLGRSLAAWTDVDALIESLATT